MKRLASLPPLIQCGLAHAQFETIHPFHGGNGGIGRLLITLILCSRGVLRRSLLYLSLFLRAHRTEYYDRLIAIRNDGAWETWLKFFLRGVAEVSRSAVDTAGNIMKLREEHRQLIGEKITRPSAMAMLDLLYEHLLTTTNAIAEHLKCFFYRRQQAHF